MTGDALYFDAPFINFCLNHHKHVVVVVKGDHRLLLQDAQQLFSQRTPDEWTEGRRTIRFWDEEGFTSCEDVKAPLRVLHTEETVRRREQLERHRDGKHFMLVLGHHAFQEPAFDAPFWHAGHRRWDIENDCFNTLSTHLALDHCFRHKATAIINFTLTCFMAYVLLQCFCAVNPKPTRRRIIGSLIGLVDELYRGLGSRRPRTGWPSLLETCWAEARTRIKPADTASAVESVAALRKNARKPRPPKCSTCFSLLPDVPILSPDEG